MKKCYYVTILIEGYLHSLQQLEEQYNTNNGYNLEQITLLKYTSNAE